MYSTQDVREYIANAAYFARGQTYMREGRVQCLESAIDNGGMLCVSAHVRGQRGARYEAYILYDEEKKVFAGCGCECPAFVCAVTGCKHVAAVALAAIYQEKQRQAIIIELERREREAIERQQKWERQRREIMQREQEIAERAEQLARRQYVSALVTRQSVRRTALPAASAPGGEVAIALTLAPADDAVLVEMKIGSSRMYVVRNFEDFAMRMARNLTCTYGKELTLTHREEAFREKDRPLVRLIALTLAPGQGSSAMRVSGANLDALMRALNERGETVLVRLGDTTVNVPIIAGEREITVHMTQGEAGTTLRVQVTRAVMGTSGVYFFDADAVRCAPWESAWRLAGLMDVARRYPDGLLLEDELLPGVCAQVIAPAHGMIAIREGAQIIASHTPQQMYPRYYVDVNSEGKITCRLRFVYDEREVAPGESAPDIRRDEALEASAVSAMRALFSVETGDGEAIFEGDDEAVFTLLSEKLPELELRGEVLISQPLSRMHIKTQRPMQLGLSVQGEELIVKADLAGYTQDELRDALAAYRQKRRFVRLRSGTFLSGEALEQAADCAQMLDTIDMTAEQAQAGGKTQAARALYLNTALKGRKSVKLSAPKAVEDWISRIQAAQSATSEPPRELKTTLYPYQKTGMAWLCALCDAGFGGILADDMGLGKTIQALSMLLVAAERGEDVRALIVCPASLQLNWKKEANRFASSLSCQVISGSSQERQTIIRENHAQVMITSYDQLRRDVNAYAGTEFTHVLLDEAQYIKNAASQAARCVKTLKAAHRFAMTGTPIENRLSELWSIFDFLMPGYLLTYKKFKERFESPIVRDQDEKTQERLRQLCAPFILRRMKADVLRDMPEKVETTMVSELTPQQHRLYAANAAQLVSEAEGGIGANNRMRVLAGLTRLRQLCCDPRLCLEDYAGGSGKFDQCLHLISEAVEGGHSILLFSQFTSMLDLLHEAIDHAGIAVFMLTGDTPKAERMELVERFNAGEARVFLISLKAGGTGLNLTGADVVIHYDPWWNTAAQNQATDRAYRIGQTRGVQVIRLIAGDTIEERIVKLQEAKSKLSDSVIGEENLFTIDTDVLKSLLT